MLKDEEAVGFVKVVGVCSVPLFFWAWSATLFFRGEGEKRMKTIHHKEHEAGRNLWFLLVIFSSRKVEKMLNCC